MQQGDSRIPYYAHHRDRLTTPLRRRADGGFDEIEWDVAIAEIAERLRDDRRQPWRQEHRPLRRWRAGQPRRRRLRQLDCCVRSARAASSMPFRRKKPATSGSMAICSAARPATPPKTCIIAISCFVIGANPWIAHGFPNARDHLNQIRKDPGTQADRHRSPANRNRRNGGSASRGPSRCRRVSPGRPAGARWSGPTGSTMPSLRSTRSASRR